MIRIRSFALAACLSLCAVAAPAACAAAAYPSSVDVRAVTSSSHHAHLLPITPRTYRPA